MSVIVKSKHNLTCQVCEVFASTVALVHVYGLLITLPEQLTGEHGVVQIGFIKAYTGSAKLESINCMCCP